MTVFKRKRSMLSAFLDYVTSSSRTAATSITSAAIGQVASQTHLEAVNTAFQHAAWTVAILAGILTMINLFFPLRSFYEQRRKSKEKIDS